MSVLSLFAALAGLALSDSSHADSAAARLRADSADTWRLLTLPGLTSAPETGFAGALALYALRTPADTATRPSWYEAGAQLTQRQQSKLFIEWDHWSAGNRWRVQGYLEGRIYPLPFYGTGPTAPLAAEEIFTTRGMVGWLTVQRRLSDGWYVQGGLRGSALTITDLDSAGLLIADTIPGARGTRVTQWRGALQYDTRDDVLTPHAGHFLQVGTGVALPHVMGGDWAYGRATVDARTYRTHGRLTIASQFVAEGLAGRAPFDDLPMLGTKSWMRGYALGRYRDRSLLAAQVEGRLQLTSRIAGALWMGGGGVAPDFSRFRSDQLLPSIGAGGRWRLFAKSRAQLRADLAFGRDGSALYLNFNEAF